MVRSLEQIYRRPSTVARLRTGPLAEHIEGFASLLLEQGYRCTSLRPKMRAVRRLGQWMNEQTIEAQHLDESLITTFLEQTPHRGGPHQGDKKTMTSLLRYLRDLGVTGPPRTATDGRTPLTIEREYGHHLTCLRGLNPLTVRYHLFHVHRFLRERFGHRSIRLDRLSHKDVTRHILDHAPDYQPRSAQTWLSVLRCFFRYLHLHGHTRADLSGSVLRTAGSHLANIPKYLSVEQVEQLLVSPDRTTASGLRDYAILLLLARVGLRGGEIVNLELEDIDWRAGEFVVRGKGSRSDRLPLPHDVGEALVAYLRHARPACATRRVFITTVAPRGPLGGSGCITSLVAHYLKRTGLHPAKRGGHVLRHSLATRMLGGGSSLEEIAQVLRHRHLNTTEIRFRRGLLRTALEPSSLGDQGSGAGRDRLQQTPLRRGIAPRCRCL